MDGENSKSGGNRKGYGAWNKQQEAMVELRRVGKREESIRIS